jgi:hypothetical protein
VEQIAGDLMPMKTLDPLIAAATCGWGSSSNEGGTIPEELRVNIARERTRRSVHVSWDLLWAAAVCHDHKFDPTTQHDFYSLSAFFNNLDEKPFNDDRPVWTPFVRVAKPTGRGPMNQVLARPLGRQAKTRCNASHAPIGAHGWPPKRSARPVPPMDLHPLRLDEGKGEVLKNIAPWPIRQVQNDNMNRNGERHMVRPDFRMQSSTRVLLGQAGDYGRASHAFLFGGWFMFRRAPFHSRQFWGPWHPKMESTQHDADGNLLPTTTGTISGALVNQSPQRERK